MRALRGA
jgi:hypothetical protein